MAHDIFLPLVGSPVVLPMWEGSPFVFRMITTVTSRIAETWDDWPG